MILAGQWEPSPPRPGSYDDAQARGFDPASVEADRADVCGDCKTAIHDGNLCLECARDRRELAIQRDLEWWSE